MYLFFYMGLGLNCLEAGKSITRAIVRVGPENLDFFGPKMALPMFVSFQSPKTSQFQGPTLKIALVLDISHLKILTYRAIKTTGSIIVKIFTHSP